MLPKGKLGVGPPNPFLRIFQYLRVGEIQQENNTLKVIRKRKKTSNTAMLKPVASSSNPISLSFVVCVKALMAFLYSLSPNSKSTNGFVYSVSQNSKALIVCLCVGGC